jgi:NTP pyrophosphatase (non-canonical NTP hydrolase)
MSFSNRLTDAQLERLAILSEELGEAQQAIGKILRHGYESCNPDGNQSRTNRDDLETELGDVMFAMSLISDAGEVSPIAVCERALIKAKKILPYLHHQDGVQP